MKKTMIILAAVLFAAGTVHSETVEQAYKEDSISIQKGGPFSSERQTIIKLGEKVKFTLKVYQDEFFGHSTISANASIKNTTALKVKAVYSISFHDKDGMLVGCHQGTWDLDGEDSVNYGSGIIYAEEKEIESVTSYKLKITAIRLNKE